MLFFVISLSNSLENLSTILIVFALNLLSCINVFPFDHVEAIDCWRRKWQPTPVFLPGESQGRWSLVGCCLWGHRESDTTETT